MSDGPDAGHLDRHRLVRLVAHSPAEFRAELERHGLRHERTSISYMRQRMVPGLPRAIDEWLKARLGWLLIVEFAKP